jgi:hypothetical protein
MADRATVYLDRYQCEKFDVEYFESCELTVRADLLLDSKMEGYDKIHRDILEPMGNKFIHLEHINRKDSPGWFRVKSKEINA